MVQSEAAVPAKGFVQELKMVLSEDDAAIRRLEEAVVGDPSLHFDLGVLLWDKGGEFQEKAAQHFLIAAKLNPQNGAAFTYLGHYYARVSVDSQRAIKCYQRAIGLNPDDSIAGEAICDILDASGKETLEIAICREASEKSPRAFWALCRLGYLLVNQKKWSEAVQSLQQAIRGYPTCADLWEALGLSYQQMGMFTAAVKLPQLESVSVDHNMMDSLFWLASKDNRFSVKSCYRLVMKQSGQWEVSWPWKMIWKT